VSPTATSVAATLRAHHITPSRSLGQNFVVDPNTVRRIARLAQVGPSDQVLEIGAGLGALTVALAQTGAAVVALEFDTRLIEPLREAVAGLNVRVVEGDALRVDYHTLTNDAPTVVVANLPYNIATGLVLRLLESVPEVNRMLVMVQHEVGERLAAVPGREGYGATSLRVAYFANAKVIGRVKPTVFYPRPRVDSALLAIDRRPAVAVAPDLLAEDALFGVIHTAFQQRRKMLRRSLAEWATPGVFDRAGIADTRRPEELSLQEFARLASAR
jgi:16S rRNA (adenine1518-N6/adenine1519-N6)-dimethyltransferase